MPPVTRVCNLSLATLLAVAVYFSASSLRAQEKPVRGEPIRGKAIRGEPIKSSKTNAPPATTATTATPTTVAAAAPQQPSVQVTGKASAKSGDFVELSFDKLANYTFEVPAGTVAAGDAGKSNGQIPDEVKAFDKKKVALTGYMLPLKVENGLVTEMLIMKDQSMCCYGAVPRINDWVSVKMAGKGVKSVMDLPVTVYGLIHIGEMLENGYLIGIYRMDGEKIAD